MRLARIPALAAALSLLLLTFNTTGRASSPPPYDCVGEACPSVTLAWEDSTQQFRVDNNSDRKVKVTVSTNAGDSYVEVEAQKSAYLQVKYFNGAYRADFE